MTSASKDREQPGVWIYKSIDLPSNAKSLTFDARTRGKDFGGSVRARVKDQSGNMHVVSDWQSARAPEYFTTAVDISQFAGQTVEFFFEHIEGGTPGSNQVYIDNIKILNEAAVTEKPSTISVKINEKLQSYDQPPLLINGRTMVPLRGIFEALGATVSWDDATQTVDAVKGSTNISLTIGSTEATVNGALKPLDQPAELINSRTLVPVRFVSEALGANVDWDDRNQTVLITYSSNSAMMTPTAVATASSALPSDSAIIIPHGGAGTDLNGENTYANGEWKASGAASGIGYDGKSKSLYSDTHGAYYRWSTNLEPGEYEIFLYVIKASGDSAAILQVGQGETVFDTFKYNFTTGVSGASGWISLGKHTFDGSSDAFVKNTKSSGATFIRADAVRFEKTK